MKTEVHFRSLAFNCTEPRAHFINDCCFGDDVCRWLIRELRGRGFETAESPEQEDFGWFFTFHVDNIDHCFVVGYQPNDPATGDQWIGWIERHVGALASMLGRRKHAISGAAVAAIDSVLSSSPEVHLVTWHEPTTP